MPDDFKRFTDLLTGAYSQQELADALGVDIQHFRQMRLDPDKAGRRPAPTGWREQLKPLATKLRADLADQLEAE